MVYVDYLANQYNNKTFKRKQDYIKYNLGKFIPSKKDLKVLEIGPGMGELVDFFNKKGIEDISIIDNDKSILDYCAKNFKINKNLLFENNINELKDDLEKYDLIFLIQVLEHIPTHNQVDFIKFLYKILNQNGRIIIIVPNANNFLSVTDRYYDFTHTSMFTSNSLIQLTQLVE